MNAERSVTNPNGSMAHLRLATGQRRGTRWFTVQVRTTPVTVVLSILGGGVGGVLGEEGLIAGEAIAEAGLVWLNGVEFKC